MNKSVFKNTGSVLAGFVTVFILSVLTDILVEALGILPGVNHPEMYANWMLVLALAYRSLFTILGGYVTARLSATKPMRNVYVLAVLGFVAGSLGAVANWNLVNPGQEWYPVLVAVTGPIFVYLGGRLRAKNK